MFVGIKNDPLAHASTSIPCTSTVTYIFLNIRGKRLTRLSTMYTKWWSPLRIKNPIITEPKDNIKAHVSQWKDPVCQWKEGIFFVSCSAFIATIIFLGMLFFYGKSWAQVWRARKPLHHSQGRLWGCPFSLAKLHFFRVDQVVHETHVPHNVIESRWLAAHLKSN